MGIRITMENRIEDLDRRLRLLEGAMEALIQTKVKRVDLTEDMETKTSTETISKTKDTKKKAPKRAESLL